MSHIRRWSSIILATMLLAAPNGRVEARPCWRPPTEAPVSDPFREPACRWCPGNRGIEYATAVGEVVRAVASGRVAFAGSVAGVRYVVVRHADGLRATYGRLASTHLRSGDVVVRGAVVGRTAGRFHFGLRDGDTYLDPAPYLGQLVRRPRLVPTSGGRGNPSPPPIVRCPR